MRLDGRPTQKLNEGGNLSEEEMLAMAISASMETNNVPTVSYGVELLPEPSIPDSGAVRIQFRMPDGSKSIRCFLETELVAVLYRFVQETCPAEHSKHLELIAGFPPKNISAQMNKSIGEAKLSGESVTGRY